MTRTIIAGGRDLPENEHAPFTDMTMPRDLSDSEWLRRVRMLLEEMEDRRQAADAEIARWLDERAMAAMVERAQRKGPHVVKVGVP